MGGFFARMNSQEVKAMRQYALPRLRAQTLFFLKNREFGPELFPCEDVFPGPHGVRRTRGAVNGLKFPVHASPYTAR
jgi:hypothetical protein